MRFPHTIPFFILWLALTTPFSTASAENYYNVDGRLIGSVESDGMHLQIEFDAHPWGGVVWTTTPAGIDVYRNAIGDGCGLWERITDEPVVWSWVPDLGGTGIAFELVDDATQPGHGYIYQARAVDAERNIILEDEYVHLGVATNGVALLAHGTLYGGPGGCGLSYVQEISPCGNDSHCYPPLVFQTAVDVAPYVNSEAVLLLYGVVVNVISPCGANETVALLSGAIPVACAVAVEERTWGSVKSLYR